MLKRFVLGFLWCGIVVGCLAGVALVYRYRLLFWDWSGQPYCHKIIDFGFMDWQLADERDKITFPNFDGGSTKSLAEIQEYVGQMDVTSKYMYVPGLRRNDPGGLVLMYLRQPTAWTWHGGPAPSIFKLKGWIIVPVDMKFHGNRDTDQLAPGEFSEWVSLDEFKYRLRKTLDFLRDNDRPNWEAVVEEHERFIDRLN